MYLNDESVQEAYAKLIQDINQDPNISLKTVADRMNREVYHSQRLGPIDNRTGSGAIHNQAIGMKYVTNPKFIGDQPTELRFFYQPRSAEEELLVREFVEDIIHAAKARRSESMKYVPRVIPPAPKPDMVSVYIPDLRKNALDYLIFCQELDLDTLKYLPLLRLEVQNQVLDRLETGGGRFAMNFSDLSVGVLFPFRSSWMESEVSKTLESPRFDSDWFTAMRDFRTGLQREFRKVPSGHTLGPHTAYTGAAKMCRGFLEATNSVDKLPDVFSPVSLKTRPPQNKGLPDLNLKSNLPSPP